MGRGSSGISAGGGGRRSFSITAANKVLNTHVPAFLSGNPPPTIMVNGIAMTGGQTGQFTSSGGFIVRTYKYTAANQIVDDGRNSITFNVTDYLMPDGKKAKDFKRDKPKAYNVKITGAVAYSTGRSGGI